MSTARSRACREPPVTVTIIVTVTFTVPIAVSFAGTVNLTTDQHYTQSWSQPQSQAEKERERETRAVLEANGNRLIVRMVMECIPRQTQSALKALGKQPPPCFPRACGAW